MWVTCGWNQLLVCLPHYFRCCPCMAVAPQNCGCRIEHPCKIESGSAGHGKPLLTVTMCAHPNRWRWRLALARWKQWTCSRVEGTALSPMTIALSLCGSIQGRCEEYGVLELMTLCCCPAHAPLQLQYAAEVHEHCPETFQQADGTSSQRQRQGGPAVHYQIYGSGICMPLHMRHTSETCIHTATASSGVTRSAVMHQHMQHPKTSRKTFFLLLLPVTLGDANRLLLTGIRLLSSPALPQAIVFAAWVSAGIYWRRSLSVSLGLSCTDFCACAAGQLCRGSGRRCGRDEDCWVCVRVEQNSWDVGRILPA